MKWQTNCNINNKLSLSKWPSDYMFVVYNLYYKSVIWILMMAPKHVLWYTITCVRKKKRKGYPRISFQQRNWYGSWGKSCWLPAVERSIGQLKKIRWCGSMFCEKLDSALIYSNKDFVYTREREREIMTFNMVWHL
jgi:hypothetical protein